MNQMNHSSDSYSLINLYENIRYPRMEDCYSGDIVPRSLEKEEERNEKLKVFPNPAINNVKISIDTEKGEQGTIKILDINDKVLQVYEVGFGNDNIEMSTKHFMSGIYFIKYHSDTGKQEIKKLLITK